MNQNINAARGIGQSYSATAPGGATPFTTSAPSIAESAAPARVEPEFIAMPAPGQTCPYSGLQRGMMYALLRDGLVRSVSLRRPGTIRERRLIVLSSLRDYLRRLDKQQNCGKALPRENNDAA